MASIKAINITSCNRVFWEGCCWLPVLVSLYTTSSGFLLQYLSCLTVLVLTVAVQPFVEEGHYLLRLFPDRFYAYLVPVLVAVCVVCFVVGNIGLVLIGAAFKSDHPEIIHC